MTEKFLKAQESLYSGYEQALSEIRNGRKVSHWIWYIFPQLKALSKSNTAYYYGIEDLEEAKAYLQHPVLRARLLEISQALLDLHQSDPLPVMGSSIDVKKLRSSMTLFREAEPELTVFQKVLDQFYHGEPDGKTLKLLKKSP